MKLIIRPFQLLAKIILLLILIMFTQQVNAQIDVTATAGTPGPTTYSTLKAAFDAINAGTHQGTITIDVTGNTTETAIAALNASGSGSASYTGITISPSGGASRTISGAMTAGSALIDLNGADNVTFDGLNSGGNSLTITNTTVSTTSGTCTILLRADATNNTITRCSVLGSATMTGATNGGNIFISTGTTSGNDNNTISYCLISGNGSSLPSKGIYGNGSTTNNTMQNSGVSVTNNEIYDYFVNGVVNAAVYVSTGNTGWTVSNNKIYQTSTRTITTATTVYGIYLTNAGTTAMGENFTISGNTIGYNNNSGTGTLTYTMAALAGSFQGITFSATASSSASNTHNITNNTISNIQWTSTSTSTFYGINSTIANTTTGAILNITGNTVRNMTSVTSTGTFIGILTGYCPTTNITNNTVSNLTRSGSSTLYGIQYTGASSSTYNISGNTISSISNTNTTSTSSLYGLYSGASPATENIYNNTIDGITGSSTGSLTVYGLFSSTATTGNKTVYGNTIRNITNSASGTGTIAAMRFAYLGASNNFYNNTIYNITGSTSVYGFYCGGTSAATNAVTNIYSNKIYGLSSSVASPIVCGILTTTSTTSNIFNNVIGDLTCPSANSAIPLYGIYASGGTNANIYYNTVRINATSGGALFGSTALYASSSVLVDLKNNILYNTSTPTGATGYATAFRRTGAYSTTYYLSSSNNNLYYAGAPGTNNLLFYDGTNSCQDLTALRTLFTGTRDNVSVTESLTFASTTGSATNYLELDATTATQAESGGQNIASYSDSYGASGSRTSGSYPKTGQVYGGGSAPDIGAYEGDYTIADLTAPTISYTALSNTASTSARTLTATITDASGVPQSGPGLPVLYWSVNGGAYNAATGTYVSGNTFNFSFGGGVSMSDVITYYIVAQDNAGTPNVGIYPFAGATGLAYNPPSATGAPSSPSSYTILASISGSFNVGATGTYATIAAAITDMSSKAMTGAVTLNLMSDYTGESSYPLNLTAIAGASGTNTITIRPDASIVSTITITSASTSGTVIINGGQYYILDGRPGGTGSNKYLSIVNTSTTSASAGNAILLYNEASNNTLTYLDVQAANANVATNSSVTTSGSIPGAIAIGTTSGSSGNDNNTISYCNIHSTGTTLGACIYAGNSTIGGDAANNDNNIITNNNIYDFFIASSACAGIDIAAGNNTYTITNNKVYQSATITITGTQTVRGFWITPNTASLTSASGYTITGNTIGYANSTGTGKMTITGTTAYLFYGMDISVGLGSATSIQNNTLAGWDITGSFASNNIQGINVANGVVNIGTVTGNLIGSTTTNGDITVTTSSTGTGTFIGIRTGGGSTINITNNTICGIDLPVTASATTNTSSINGIAASGGTTVSITNNVIGSTTLSNSINLPGTSSTSTTAQVMRGITINGATTVTCTGNTIANINTNYNGTSTGATMVGIYVTSGTVTVSDNTIRNLTSNALNSNAGGSTPTVGGIVWTSTTAPATISNNVIHTLKATNASNSSAVYVTGIYYGGPTSGSNIIQKNFIHSISLASSGTGSYISGMDIASGLITISNNMLRLGLDESGSSITTALTVRGITKNTASSSIYNNTIYIGGTGVGTTATNTFALVKTGAPVSTDDWRNNILINQRSNATTGGKHYPIYLSATSSLTLNNNVYYGAGTGYVFGYNGAADVSSYSAGWISGDVSSYGNDPLLLTPTGTSSTVDLHVNTGSATVAESGGATISSVTTDFDGNTRQGQVGYAGTGTAPDIGADEFNGIAAPSMAYSSASLNQQTGSSFGNATNQRILRILVTTAGAVNPISATSFTVNANGSTTIADITNAKIYYTGSSSVFSSSSLFGTNGTPTIADFTITGTQQLVEGSNYFWLTFDIAASPGAGNAIDGECSSITIAGVARTISSPAPSGSRTISGPMSGTFTIGTASTDYITITDAITDVVGRGVSGAVVFNLLDASYSGSETFPLTIGEIAGSSVTNTITFKPASGVTSAITGTAASGPIIKLNGADYVIFDGSNNGSTTQNLTLTNSSGTAPVVFQLISNGTTSTGCNYITIKNCNITSATNTTVGYGVSIGGATIGTGGADHDNVTIQNNAFTNVLTGVYANGTAANSTGGLDNLLISQNSFSFTTTVTGGMGIRAGYCVSASITRNTFSLETNNVGACALSLETGFISSSVTRNEILKVKQSTSTQLPVIRGIAINTGQTGSDVTIANNVIYNVISAYATTNIGSNPVGILIGASGVSTTYTGTTGGVNVYHNSINMYGNVDRSAATYSYGIFIGSGVTGLDVRNNIIANSITNINASGTGHKSYCIYTQAASAFTSIDYNFYYAGGSQSLVGYLTSDRAAITDWRTATASDVNSSSSNPNYTSNTNLIPQLGSPVLAVGTPLATVTTDFLGTTRSGTTPTIGAYEEGADVVGPVMTFTALGNTTSTSNRNLNSVAITDVSGVNTTAGTKPRLYYKLSTENNTYVGNTSSDNGWKYVESASGSSPFDFTMDYSLLTGTVSSGSTIQYFIVAQDLASTPNVGISNGTFAATPSSVALTSGAFPIGGTPGSYSVTPSYSGAYNVGTSAPTYTTLKSFFDALNAGVITGNITINLIDNCTETASAVLNVTSEEPASSNFTITINPSGGAARTITGNIAGPLVKLNGADRVTFNGLNTGGNSLTLTNTNTSASSSVIWLSSSGVGSGCTDNTITNCTITGGSSSVTFYGIALSGSTIAATGSDNDNNTISNNTFTVSANPLYIYGGANATSGGNNNLTITGNTITTNTSVATIGIQLYNTLSSTVSQNTIDVQQSTSNAPVGISIETGCSNINITANKITRAFYNSTSGYGGRGITIGTGATGSNITVSNNVIYGVSGDNFSSFTNSSSAGIMLGTIGASSTLTTSTGGINLYNNSVYMSGTYSRATACITAALYVGSAVSGLDIRNNIFMNDLDNSGTASKSYSVYCAAASSAFSSIDYNNYYVSGPEAVLSYLGSDISTLSGLITAFGGNSNSVSSDPGFTSSSNLQITSTFPSPYRVGTSIGGITTDYSGTTRSTPPDMGAYEGAVANRWIGGTSNAWATNSNWDNGSAPTSAGNTQIDAGVSNSPVLSTSFNAGNLYIPSGKSLSLNGNILTVSGTISGTGTLVGTGSLVMDGSGTGGTLYMDQTTAGTTNKLTNLTLNRSGETLTLGSATLLSGVFTPTAGTLATGDNLTLLSTASGDASIAAGSGTYITGNVTVQRYVPAGTTGRGYRYLAAPFVTGPNISASWQQQIYITGSGTGGTACPSLTAHSNGFDASTYNNASMSTFNETGATITTGSSNASGGTVYSNAWTSVANTNGTTLSAGKGYNVYVRGNRSQGCSQLDGSVYTPTDVTLSASGTVQTGSYTYTGATYSASNGDGWNLVGNPYPSAIDWDHASWTKTNVLPTIWVYRVSTNSYATYNTSSGGVNGGSNIIPSGTGFFIHATGTPTFAIAEAAKTSSAPASLLLKNKPFDIRMKLTKASNNYTDELLIALNREQATDIFDQTLDAEKMNNPNNVNLYAIDGMNKKYAINAIAPIPDNAEKIVPLGIASPVAGSYSLNLEPVSLPSYYQVFLRDHYLQTEKQIEVGQALSYSFQVNSDSASFGNTRFDLFIANNRPHSTGLQGNTSNNWNLSVYPNPTEGKFTIAISGRVSSDATISVYNSVGQKLFILSDIQQSQFLDLSNFTSGVYFVEYSDGQEVLKTIKLIKK